MELNSLILLTDIMIECQSVAWTLIFVHICMARINTCISIFMKSLLVILKAALPPSRCRSGEVEHVKVFDLAHIYFNRMLQKN